MKFKVREGLVRESICGKELLIATLEARNYCPYLTELNSASAFIWDMLEKGADTDQIADCIEKEYDLPRERVLSVLEAFLSDLEKNSFIIRQEQA